MSDLNLAGVDAVSLAELTGYHEVSVSDTGLVKCRRKGGKWQSGLMGLPSWTEESIAKANPAGIYSIRLPTPKQSPATPTQGAIASIPNPWRKTSWNLTQQLMLADQDPELTARFKQEAGV